MPAARRADALSRRFPSAQRARGLDASAVVAQDMVPAAAVRRVSLARASRRRVPPQVRRAGLPDLPDAARGGQRLFAAAASRITSPEARAAARRGWGIEPDAFVPLFVGKLVTSKRPLEHRARGGDAGPGRLGAGGRVGPARGGDASRGRPERRRSESDRVPESDRARSRRTPSPTVWCCRATFRKRGAWSSTKRSRPACRASSATPWAARPICFAKAKADTCIRSATSAGWRGARTHPPAQGRGLRLGDRPAAPSSAGTATTR